MFGFSRTTYPSLQGFRCQRCQGWVYNGDSHYCGTYVPAGPYFPPMPTMPPAVVPAKAPPGWRCPSCGRVFAPWVPECTHCQPLVTP